MSIGCICGQAWVSTELSIVTEVQKMFILQSILPKPCHHCSDYLLGWLGQRPQSPRQCGGVAWESGGSHVHISAPPMQSCHRWLSGEIKDRLGDCWSPFSSNLHSSNFHLWILFWWHASHTYRRCFHAGDPDHFSNHVVPGFDWVFGKRKW